MKRFLLALFILSLAATASAQTTTADRFVFNPIATGPRSVAGSGSPEGVVTASPSSIYHRTDTGTIYVKATGTGNTGWILDTGGTIGAPGAAGTFLRSNGSLWLASTSTIFDTIAKGGTLVSSDTNVLSAVPAAAIGRIFMAQGTTEVPDWSVAKYPSAAPGVGTFLRGDGTDWLTSTLTLPNTVAAGDMLVASSINVLSPVTVGGSGTILRSNGTQPVYSITTYPNGFTAGDTFVATGTNAGGVVSAVAAGRIFRAAGVGTVPTWSTATYPDTVTANRLLYASATNVVGEDADLTFATDTLTATKLLSPTSVSTPSLISTGAVTVTPLAGTNLNVVLSTTGDFVVNTNQLVVDTSAGNVGIGTATPTTGQLQVEKASHISNQVVINNGQTGAPPTIPFSYLPTLTVAVNETADSRPLFFGYDSGTSWNAIVNVGACGSFAQMCVNLGTGSADYTALVNIGTRLNIGGGGDGDFTDVSFQNSGRVGIGTIAPLAKLSINGGLHVGGDSDPGDNNALVDGTLAITGAASFSSTAGEPSFVSQTTGWRVTAAGALDVRYLYTDELRAKLFTADLESVLAGSQRVTKSFSTISQTFTCPAASGTSTLWVKDAPTFGDAAIFVSGDAVIIHSMTRTVFGPFTIADCVGVVTAYADGTGGNAGQQSWTFTRGAGGNAGTMTASTTVAVDQLVQDFGTTGNGYVETSAVDGAAGINAPYTQIVTWTTAPVAANLTVRTRLGNLLGITGTAEYGLIAGTYAATNGTFFRASNTNFDLHGITQKFWDGATNVITLAPNAGAPYLGIGNPAPAACCTTAGVFLGWTSGDVPAFSAYKDANNFLTYNGSVVTWKGANTALDASGNLTATSATLSGALTATSGTFSGAVTVGTGGSLASGATSYTVGTGYWLDYNVGTPRFRIGTTAGNRFAWDGTNVTLVSANLKINDVGLTLLDGSTSAILNSYLGTVRLTANPGLISLYSVTDYTDIQGATAVRIRANADTVTNASVDQLIIDHDATTAANVVAGFGTGLLFKGTSTTTDFSDMARIQSIWTTATHASRASALQFQTLTAAGALTTRMTIDGAGKVGIGLTGPNTFLEVLGAADVNSGQVRISAAAAVNAAGLSFWTGGGSTMRNWQLQSNYTDAGDFRLLRSTTNTGNPTTPVLSVNSSGQVRFLEAAVMVPASTGTAAWGVDSTDSSTITIANDATATPFSNAANFSGQVIITDTNVTGQTCLFLVGGAVGYVGTSSGTTCSHTAETAGKLNFFLNGSSVPTIQNKLGSSVNVRVFAIRTRTSP